MFKPPRPRLPLLFLLVTLVAPLLIPAHARDGSYRKLINRMRSVCDLNARICSLSTIDSMYGLGTQGSCGADACQQHVMRIGCGAPSLPHVFVSGALHGDERLGPIATVEFGALLMRQYGRSRWSTRMVDTRCIVLFPIANSRGYYMREREDNGVDPNRCARRHDIVQCHELVAAAAAYVDGACAPVLLTSAPPQRLRLRAPRLLQVPHGARRQRAVPLARFRARRQFSCGHIAFGVAMG
jgi:hypothetical protein